MVERGPESERGAALMTVLLLVAVMSVITATALERLTIATRLTANVGALDQARAYALGAEAIAGARITDLVNASPDRTTLAGGWMGTPQPLPIPGGGGSARVTDGGNCFNLNSLVTGNDPARLVARPTGIAQFAGLMLALDVDPRLAAAVAAAAADWIDSDSVPQPGGAEDEAYARRDPPYRTANGWMADPSELRAVAGVTPELYARLRPWLCALPTSDLSTININTLLPVQAPLLAMLLPGRLGIDQAHAIVAARPRGGWEGSVQFWSQPALKGLAPTGEIGQQAVVRTRWFAVETRITIGDATSEETALFDTQQLPARLVRRSWNTAS